MQFYPKAILSRANFFYLYFIQTKYPKYAFLI